MLVLPLAKKVKNEKTAAKLTVVFLFRGKQKSVVVVDNCVGVCYNNSAWLFIVTEPIFL